MKTTVINIKSDRSLKAGAEQFAKELGISLSDLVNLSLRYVVTTRSITLDLRPTPNAATDAILREELAHIKKGQAASPKFETTKEAFAWLDSRAEPSRKAKK